MSGFSLYKRPRVGPVVAGAAIGVSAALGANLVGLGSGGGTSSADAAIVGGGSAASDLDGPVVRVSYRDLANNEVLRCTGSVIAAEWVLTAAHCLEPTAAGDPSLRPVVGLPAGEAEVVDVRIHPDYRPEFVAADPATTGAHYDVGLLRLDRLAAVERVVLSRAADETSWPVGTQLTIAGHGATVDAGPVAGRLMAAETVRLTPAACGVWGEVFNAAMHLCTSSMTTATCNGDSGGPVLVAEPSGRWMQVGIMVFGDVECGSGVPDVHVRVDAVRSWIEDQVGALDDPEPIVSGPGYWLVTDAGEVIEFGDARFHGDLTGQAPLTPVVAMAVSPSGAGYVLVEAGGVVHGFGDVGVPSGIHAPAAGDRVAAAAMTPTGQGLWLFSEAGLVTAIGDAGHYGDLAGIRLNGPVVEAVATTTGHGYWLTGADGGLFTFGDATFRGSMGGFRLNQQVVSMTPSPGGGGGYWMVAADGGIFAFDAPYRGSVPAVLAPGVRLNSPVRGMAAYGNGYVLFAADGGVFAFSDLAFRGSLGDDPPDRPIVAVGVLP